MRTAQLTSGTISTLQQSDGMILVFAVQVHAVDGEGRGRRFCRFTRR